MVLEEGSPTGILLFQHQASQSLDRWTQLRLQQSGESAVTVVVRPQFPLQKLVIHRLWLKCTGADLILGSEKKALQQRCNLVFTVAWSLLQQCWNLMFNLFDSDCIGWTIHCLKLLDHQEKIRPKNAKNWQRHLHASGSCSCSCGWPTWRENEAWACLFNFLNNKGLLVWPVGIQETLHEAACGPYPVRPSNGRQKNSSCAGVFSNSSYLTYNSSHPGPTNRAALGFELCSAESCAGRKFH